MFGNFTEDARSILMEAKKEMAELKHPYIGSEHLLLSILKSDNEVSTKLKEYDLDYNTFKDEVIKIIGYGSKESESFLYTPLLKRIIEDAIIDSKENNSGDVSIENLFSGLLEEGEGVAIRIMAGLNIDLDKLYDEFSYKLVGNKKKKNKKLLIEQMGIDLNEKALNNELDPVIGRDMEMERIIEILCRRTKNNPLLIGEAGVGKTALAEELARRIVLGNVPILLRNKRVISIDMASLVSGTKYRGEFEERMRKLLKEIEDNSDIIVFIDEIHTLVGAGGAEGAIDASNIFKPALARNSLRCIGATTTAEYKKYIEKDSALERRFQKIIIEKPNKETIKEILMKVKPIYEKFHLVRISEHIIDLIIDLASRYVHDRNEPDRSIDILDEVCAKVHIKESKDLKKYRELNSKLKDVLFNKNEAIIVGNYKEASSFKDIENKLMTDINSLEINLQKHNNYQDVTDLDVASVINHKTRVPVYELLNNQKAIINEAIKTINSNIVGQNNACLEVIKTLKRLKYGYKYKGCYSMLFCGPSGVGKTSLAKIFGSCLVGNDSIIKLDMSEYSESHSVSKILGAPPGYVGFEENNTILEEIRNKPHSVLILDEIEKANPKVLGLFYQILDDGKIKDSSGRVIYFDNVFIVMTSNIGFEQNKVGFNESNNSFILDKLKERFSVSFINRIDNTIIFDALNEESIELLIKHKLKLLKNKYKKINLKFGKTLITEIINLSHYQEYGARKIDKILFDNVENIVVDALIEGKKELVINKINIYS